MSQDKAEAYCCPDCQGQGWVWKPIRNKISFTKPDDPPQIMEIKAKRVTCMRCWGEGLLKRLTRGAEDGKL